jgi:hypothetical protein
MLASRHRWKSARTAIIVNNIAQLVTKRRGFGAEDQILTIIARAPLVRTYSDREQQDG